MSAVKTTVTLVAQMIWEEVQQTLAIYQIFQMGRRCLGPYAPKRACLCVSLPIDEGPLC